jgi:PAS domain S-box-containing protein
VSFTDDQTGTMRRPRRRSSLKGQLEHPADEVKRLQRCINDLVGVFALPALWSGGDPSRIVRTLLEVLLDMLRLDLVYVRVKNPVGTAPIEMVRVAHSRKLTAQPQEIGEILNGCLGPDPQKWAPLVQNPIGDGDISIVPLRLGLQDEIGIIVAGSQRADFPAQTERLILSTAANLAAIGLREATLLSDQKRVAHVLDQRVLQRTRQLAKANEDLRTQIAERTRAEEKLKQSEIRKSAVVDSALDCIVTIDHEGRIAEFNPAAEHTFGYRRDEVVGKYLADIIIPPSLRNKHRQGFARYLATGEARVLGRHIEMTAVRADGSEFPVELAITRIPLDGPPSFTGYLRDITARRQAEQKLRESELNLRQMTETIPEMLWSATPEGEIDYCNARVLDYTGFSAEEVMGQGWMKLLHPDDVDQTTRLWMSCVTTAAPYRAEVRTFHAADRTYRWCVTSALPMLDEEGCILRWHGTVVDMHDWRRAQDELRNMQAEHAHMMRVTTMGELTASIAHEVNQPLASIITNGQTGLRRLAQPEPDLEKVRELTKRVVADARRASEIIDRIRTMATRRAPEPTPLSLADIIEESMVFLHHEFQSRGISVALDLAPELPQVVGDRTQLQQVVVNLAINAVQAMAHSGGRNILIRTKLPYPETVSCIIEDSGPGIDPAHLPHLFDSFFTTKDSGMGMGLPISQSIIETHGGHIRADNISTLGGARFSFTLPAQTETSPISPINTRAPLGGS